MNNISKYIIEKLHLNKNISVEEFNDNDFKEFKKKKDGNYVIVVYRYLSKGYAVFKIIDYDKYTATINKQKEYLRLHPKRHPVYPYNEWSFIVYTDTKEEAKEVIKYLRTLKEYSYVSENKDNDISDYISEKLHLNKNIETSLSLDDKEYNTHIDMWFASDDIYRVRDYVHDNTNAVSFGISKIKKDGDDTLYKIYVENRHDFLHIIILVLKFIYNFNDYKHNIKDIEKERWESCLNNFEEIKELIYTFSNKEVKDAYDEEIK